MVKHLRVGCRIDFALQNLFRTGDGESRYFVTESFTGTKHFLRCFRLGGSNDGIGTPEGGFV